MEFINRLILPQILRHLERGKSILLLGARQTGKTTLVTKQIKPDISYSFAKLETKYRYEKNPVQFEKDLTLQIEKAKQKPLVFIDEVQKIPEIMDSIQHLIDNQKAQFVLSGSSARKLKHRSKINLLPGRVVTILLDPLTFEEIPYDIKDLEQRLISGALPGISFQRQDDINIDLANYVMAYLEEEIRQEALVRNVASFSQCLELAAIESGNCINFSKISQDIGVSDHTVKEYFQILVDCLVAFKITPITETFSRRVLLKAPKYLFFDLGVRRLAANEGDQASIRSKSQWFEQYVGLEIIRNQHISHPLNTLHFWRDKSGVEVDYVIKTNNQYIPIEVKWSEAPQEKDARHLIKFLEEYKNAEQGYIVCRTPTAYAIRDNVIALPWQDINTIEQ